MQSLGQRLDTADLLQMVRWGRDNTGDILSILILKLREVSEDHTYDTIEFNEVNSLTVLLHCWLFLTFLIENVLLSFILFVHLYSWKTLAKTKMTPNALLTQNTMHNLQKKISTVKMSCKCCSVKVPTDDEQANQQAPDTQGSHWSFQVKIFCCSFSNYCI